MKLNQLLWAFTAGALTLAACGSNATPTSAPVEATATKAAPPATATPAVPLGAEQRYPDSGFAFRPPSDFTVSEDDGLVFLLPPNADDNPSPTGPIFLLAGGANDDQTDLDTVIETMVAALGGDGLNSTVSDATIGGVPGKVADLSGNIGDTAVAGRLAVALTAGDTQGFTFYGIAPEADWPALAKAYDAVLGSVTLLDLPPTPTEPAVTPTPVPLKLEIDPGLYIYSDANEVRELVSYEGKVYVATPGGMVVWDTATGNYVKHTPLDGMSSIGASAIAVCNMPEPRIVVGLEKGIDLFDPATGQWEHATFAPAEAYLDNNQVWALHCDQANQRLLIGYSGLGVYDFGAGTFKRYTTDSGLSWSGVNDIAVAGKDIWVASGYNGLSVIQGEKVTIYNQANGLPNERASALAVAKDGTVWVGTSAGLVQFKSGKWKLYDYKNVEGMGGEISSLSVAPDGTVWLTTFPLGVGTICQFDPKTETCLQVFKYEVGGVSDLALTAEGQVFVGTWEGVQLFAEGTLTPWKVMSDQLYTNFVDALALTPDGQLWVGTDGGAHRFDPAKPEAFWENFRATYKDGDNQPSGRWFEDIAFAPNGDMWVAVINSGVNQYTADGQWIAYKDLYSANAIAVDGAGNVWAAPYGKGVIMFDGKKTTAFTEAEGLLYNYVNALAATGEVVWIGTGHGLVRYEDGAMTTIFDQDTPDLPSAVVVDLLAAPNGDLLIVTSGGLLKYADDELTVLATGKTGSLSDLMETLLSGSLNALFSGGLSFSSVALGREGELYLGTYGSGVFISTDGGATWENLSTADGLPSNNINELLVDQYNTLWIGAGYSNGGGGLTRYVP